MILGSAPVRWSLWKTLTESMTSRLMTSVAGSRSSNVTTSKPSALPVELPSRTAPGYMVRTRRATVTPPSVVTSEPSPVMIGSSVSHPYLTATAMGCPSFRRDLGLGHVPVDAPLGSESHRGTGRPVACTGGETEGKGATG